ncbi:MAG: hypothetical protein AB3N33_02955 [Puniceicoccaceae bacterium]
MTLALPAFGAGSAGVDENPVVPLNGEPTYTDPAEGTYFLDAVNGNDNNDGRSPETAWQTLERLSDVRIKAGEVVLFKAGDVFTGRFYLWGSGTPQDPIVFGAYGTGAKPLLQGGEQDVEVIYITGDRGLEFRNLQISNDYPAGSIPHRYGIRIQASAGSGDMQHFHFHDLDFINIEGADPENESRAIMAEALDFGEEPDSLRSRFNGFIVEDCLFSNIDGRAVQFHDRNQSLSDSRIRGRSYYPSIGFVFQNNTGINIHRNMLQLQGTKDAVIQYNYMSGTNEGSAFWPFDTDGTLVQFNDFRHLRNEKADSYICHFDYNCIDTLMQYNFGYDVDGGLVEIIVLSDFSFFQEDAVARYNIGVDVGFRNKANSAGIMLSGRVTRSKVYNNTIVTTNRQSSYKAIAINNWGGEWPDNNAIHNNLFLATGNPSTFDDIGRMTQAGNVLSHNLYHGNITLPGADLSPVSGDPLVLFPGNPDPKPMDMMIQAGSPAIAAGMLIADNGGRDFFDNPLPDGLVPSIGAHEFQTEGMGRWAGFKIGDTGYVDTGSGFLGWIWVGADGGGISNWMYSVSAGQWVYLPEDYINPGAGSWLYLYDSAALSPADIRGEWFFAQAFSTWVASYGDSVGSGSAWLYALDLSGSQ